jgi:hypothetical protein
LKPASGTAGAEVVAAELLEQLFIAVNDPYSALYARLRRIAFAALAARFKSSGPRWSFLFA